MIIKQIVTNDIPLGLYEIDENGEVYSIRTKRKMSSVYDRDGYLKTALTNSHTGKRHYYRISQLVAYSFLGKQPKDMCDPTVDHIDGNKTNNHFTNLRWLERSDNSRFRKTSYVGSLNPAAVLTEKEVMDICYIIDFGNLTLKQISILYKVEKSTISNIKRRKTWGSVTKIYDENHRKG